MQSIGNQPNAKNQFHDNGQTGNNEREIEAEEMIAVNVNLELVHIENLKDSRDDENKAQEYL